jgi:hypothetical protein
MSESGWRIQVRLGDLVVLVVGSAVVFAVIRHSSLGWEGGKPDRAQVMALIVMTLGVGLGLILVGEGFRRFRDRSRAGWGWAMTWRLLAMVGFGWLLVEVASASQLPPEHWTQMVVTMKTTMRLNAVPLVTSLAMVGLILAMGPFRLRPRAPRLKPGWGSRFMVILAVVAAVAFVGIGNGIFPYLVLLALEAVHNAMIRAPLIRRPILFDRLDLALLEALPGLAGCVLTALWVDDDLRAVASDPSAARTPRSWFGVLGRASTVALAGLGSFHVVWRSIPKLSPPVAEGLGAIFELSTVVTLILGLAGFAAGISARAAAILADRRDPPEPRVGSRWPWRIGSGIVGLVLLEILASVVLQIQGDHEDHWYVPIPLELWRSLAVPLVDQPFFCLTAAVALWVAYRLALLILSRNADQPCPLDLLAADRLAFGRFLGWWVGLSTLMVASVPILAIVSVNLTHHAIRWLAN